MEQDNPRPREAISSLVTTAYEQEDVPLFRGLVEHARKNRIPFHIPGHKRGMGMDPAFREYLGENALAIDLINIAPVDDLHHPQGMIKEAQELAAEAFGAERSFFSVQGTSGAIMAMILAAVGPGEKILIPRNVHKSVLTAVVLSGVRPVFMEPEIDRVRGVAHGVSLATVRRRLEQHPDAKAVLVVNPTYFGVCADLRGIAEVVHERGIPLLVDEAHGAHLYFHPELPISAMEAGADAAATSVHKLGGSLTQSSILNVQGDRISSDRVQAVLSMLTTTSTSYILLASLDAARRSPCDTGASFSLAPFPRRSRPPRRQSDPGPQLPRPGGDWGSELFVRFRSDQAVHHGDGPGSHGYRGRSCCSARSMALKSSSPTCTTSSV